MECVLDSVHCVAMALQCTSLSVAELELEVDWGDAWVELVLHAKEWLESQTEESRRTSETHWWGLDVGALGFERLSSSETIALVQLE